MKRLVLIIEDDLWQAEHLEKLIIKAGYRVSKAAHAYEAVDLVDDGTPDLIILDMMLPGANGMVLLHELRSHDDLAAIPIIVVSTLGLNESSLQPYGVGAVLDKTTMTSEDLLRTVRRLLI